MLGEPKLEPAMPISTKYGLFFFTCFTIAGVILLVKSRSNQSTISPYMQVVAKQNTQNSEKKQGEQDAVANPWPAP